MTPTLLSPGDSVEARCTKCRKNTRHLIIAMADGDPVKVRCDICDREHKYRPPTTPKKSAAKTTRNPQAAEMKEWEELQPSLEPKKAVDYTMTTAFKVGTLMKHPAFGLGIVQRMAGPRKIEVLFQDGKKIMRCQ